MVIHHRLHVRMRYRSLADALVVVKHKCQVQLTGGNLTELEGQTCHILFSTKRVKHQVLSQFANASVIVVPCGGYGATGQETVLDRPLDFGQLIRQLHAILAGKLVPETVLNTLVVDNISVFYWDLRVAEKSNFQRLGFDYFAPPLHWYLQLHDVLDQIRVKYRCNIIVTSFDVNSDKGYFSAYKEVGFQDFAAAAPSLLTQGVSYLPYQYLSKFDRLIHCSTHVSRLCNGSSWH